MEGEEQIDIDKINKERSMATVDEEEHAVLDRLSFDYHQKLQGKPQSHEMVRFIKLHYPMLKWKNNYGLLIVPCCYWRWFFSLKKEYFILGLTILGWFFS